YDQELEVLLVSETSEDAEKPLQQVDLDLPDVLDVFSFGALVDSGSFPARLLLDPQFDPVESSSSLSSLSRRLFNVTVSPYMSKSSSAQVQIVENTDDEDNDEDSHGMNVEGDEGANEEDEANKLYRDVKINLEGQQQSLFVSSRFVLNMLNPSPDIGVDSIFESTLRVDVLVMTTAELPLLSAITLPPPSIPIISHVQQKPAPSPINIPSSSLQDLPNIGSLFRLRDEAQAENEDFLNKLDENIQKIIKEEVKEQVKVQVSKILPKIKKTINEQLEVEVLTRSSNSSKTSHAVAAD
nr:hypothetical protein [Tanacetum cinerariifolium]